MLGEISTGLIAAVLVLAPQLIQSLVQSKFGPEWAAVLRAPILILGVSVIAVLLQRFLLDRQEGSRNYDGLADLMIHIHSPATPDSASRWTVRGVISFLLTLCGGVAGPEGAAVEISHAFAMKVRARSARWFEQRRRTDASMTLSAAMAATFRAPFAGVLLPLELGIGGRTISSAVAALSAFLFGNLIIRHFSLEHFDVAGALEGFRFAGWKSWASPLVVGAGMGVFGALLIRFMRYGQDSLLDLFQTQAWMRILAAGAIIFLIALIYRGAHGPSRLILEDTFWSRHSFNELGLLLCCKILILTMLVAGFGTLGIFWPLFAIGGMIGFGFDSCVWHALPGFSLVIGFAGAAAIWGSVLGTPVTAAILCYELTQNSQILLPCLIAGLIAKWVRTLLKTPPLFEIDLQARGFPLVGGRSAAILEHLYVREAMVTDHELVHEHEPVAELFARLTRSPYAFLPVVNSQGIYMGLLTADMIQEAWKRQSSAAAGGSPLAKLVGAKDLLYRSGLKIPSVRAGDRLSASAGVFKEMPCVPVVTEDQRVVGLLFVYNVRLSYDQEVARRSLSFESREM
jgi:CIC family chloride channel protein